MAAMAAAVGVRPGSVAFARPNRTRKQDVSAKGSEQARTPASLCHARGQFNRTLVNRMPPGRTTRTSCKTQCFAPVAQWIEQRFPKPRAQVRFLPGALASKRLPTPFSARPRDSRQERASLASWRSRHRSAACVTTALLLERSRTPGGTLPVKRRARRYDRSSPSSSSERTLTLTRSRRREHDAT
jgi:hypothetical protein